MTVAAEVVNTFKELLPVQESPWALSRSADHKSGRELGDPKAYRRSIRLFHRISHN